jgi:hypothetical protein
LAFLGVWDETTEYVINDVVVASDNNTYVSLTTNTDAGPPSNPTDWAIFAEGGETGPSGPAGETGPTGPSGPTLTFTGIWSAATSYVINDVAVVPGGDTYVALTSNINSPPASNPTDWAVYAIMGPSGPSGETGPTGPAGGVNSITATGTTCTGAITLQAGTGITVSVPTTNIIDIATTVIGIVGSGSIDQTGFGEETTGPATGQYFKVIPATGMFANGLVLATTSGTPAVCAAAWITTVVPTTDEFTIWVDADPVAIGETWQAHYAILSLGTAP